MEKYFSFDAKTILSLGKDSIKDNTTAILELVKNSYDADAKKVEIEIFSNFKDHAKNYIRIADNGIGMSEKEIDNNWLKIGYSEKRTKKITDFKRKKVGEKGIGRLSADRLGSYLVLITKSKGKVFGLNINWDDFNIENKDATKIPLVVIDKPVIKLPSSSEEDQLAGTELIISFLRQKWNENDIKVMFEELSILTPPFKNVKDFQIELKNDINGKFNGIVKSPFIENAEIELRAKYDGNSLIKYEIKDRMQKQKLNIIQGEIRWINLIQKIYKQENLSNNTNLLTGPIEIELLFYPRDAKVLEGTNFSLTDLRNFLDRNSGIKIYRDNIRVKPYGSSIHPEGDWLQLADRKTREPAAISRPTWKVNSNQIVGAVFISRDENPNLVDSTSREGLLHGDEFFDLTALTLGCVTLLETHRFERNQESVIVSTGSHNPSEDVHDLNKDLLTLNKELNSIQNILPLNAQRTLQKTIDRVGIVSDKIKSTQKSIDELVSQSQIFRSLATIGITSAVFGHETQSSVEGVVISTKVALEYLKKNKPNMINIAVEELEKSINHANHIASWGSFALSRVQRDKRHKRKQPVDRIINKTLDEIMPLFNAADIKIKRELAEIQVKIFSMDVEAIILNLLTNAYTACLHKKERMIHVILKVEERNSIEGFVIIVIDSGTGIDKKFINRIWEPLFTTRVDKNGKEIGTGLGLSIINAIVNDMNGEKKVTNDKSLKGARFEIWIPI